jgi:hypothetical protein
VLLPVSDDLPDPTPEDAMHVSQRALSMVKDLGDEIEKLREENEELRERVVALEAALPDRGEYDDLDRQTKVGMVREHLVERARDQHGAAAIDYDGVMWEVFDGEPSADHCYTLMKLAAQAEGFDTRDPSGGNKELAVDLDSTKPVLGFSHANKDSVEGGR